ncbi:hypothetical protein I4U23_019737 [Adineta vaga]|nr:hypothetical protein I4U23_019737 [Adineta vaga]
MTSNIECLPNEILIDVFEYLDAQSLFNAFYKLNYRLNNLLYSLTSISLTISKKNTNRLDHFQEFFAFINKLTIEPTININFDRFIKIRCLSLTYVPNEALIQLQHIDILPCLEHLLIVYRVNQVSTPGLHQKIFSNGFSKLISCQLLGLGTMETADNWTQSPSLRILHVRTINLLVYKAILSACPNLYFLRLNIPKDNLSSLDVEPHLNIKRMILKIPLHYYLETDDMISDFLSITPNLEQFCIQRFIWDIDSILFFVDYDWLAKIIHIRLRLLRRFVFKLYFSTFIKRKKSSIKSILNRIDEHFKEIHNKQYESRLIVPLTELCS